MAGTSPSINDTGDIAYQGTDGHLKIRAPSGTVETGPRMMAGTSPSINDDHVIAFHADTGEIGWKTKFALYFGPLMKAGTSPSVRDTGGIAYQDTLGELRVFSSRPPDFDSYDIPRLGMMAGTSPSIN